MDDETVLQQVKDALDRLNQALAEARSKDIAVELAITNVTTSSGITGISMHVKSAWKQLVKPLILRV